MNKPTAYLLVSSAIVLWGLGGIFTKNILEAGVGALEIAFWRLLLSGVLFTLQAFAQRDFKLKAAKDLWYFAGFAVFIITLNYLSFNYAVQHGGVSLVNLLLAVVPMLITLFAWLFFRERLTLRLLGLLALSMIGLLFASWGGGHGVHISSASLGFSFLAVVTTAASKGLLGRYSPVSMNAFIMPLAALALLPFVTFHSLPLHVCFDMALLVLLPSYLTYLLYQAGLEHLETTEVALLTNLEPVTGLLFAALLFNERFNLLGTFGVVLVLTVSVLAVLPQAQTRPQTKVVKTSLRPVWQTLDKPRGDDYKKPNPRAS
jgi:drug/metabolite transporter, DME family